jgi:sugar phosphate permease
MENDKEINFPTPVVAWTTLAILFLAYISSFVDRMIISLLVEPIKADFQISDTQISLLLGLS